MTLNILLLELLITGNRKMKRYITIFGLFLSCLIYARKPFVVSHQYKNVKIVVVCLTYSEYINQALIVGEYAERYCDSINFNKPITLFFGLSNYRNRNEDNSFEMRSKKKEYKLTNGECVSGIIIGINKEKDLYKPENVLSFIEYSLKNISENIQYFPKKIPISELIKQISRTKVLRPMVFKQLIPKNNTSIDYYYQNEKFYVFSKKSFSKSEVLELAYIENFYPIYNEAVIFTNKYDFLWIGEYDLSRKWLINEQHIESENYSCDRYKPFYTTQNKLFLNCLKGDVADEEVLVYYKKENRLIKDIDKLISPYFDKLHYR